MAYADFQFYSSNFHGDTLTEETAEKWLELASDEVDNITFGRLTTAFPEVDGHIIKVKKAVCAVADALFLIDIQRKTAAAQQTADGSYRGPVSSVTSGRESISYSNGNTAASIYSAAAASELTAVALLANIAAKYLANIPDASGINLLYAGG